MRGLLKISIVAAFVLGLCAPAHATFPGENGKIAFGGSNNVMTIEPDGSNLTSLGPGYVPAWSPDGKQIAFVGTDGSLWVMDADGSNRTEILNRNDLGDVAWSPDGTQLVYKWIDCSQGMTCFGGLRIVNTDGSGDHSLYLNDPYMPSDPGWSADGDPDRLLERSIRASDRSARRLHDQARRDSKTQITHDGNSSWGTWSPDAQRILFGSVDGNLVSSLASMNPDGSGRTSIPGNLEAKYPSYSRTARESPIYAGNGVAAHRWRSG